MDLHQLRYANPGSWQAAADDLLAAAKDCEEAVAEIHGNGTRRLEESWTDYLGDIVRGRISDVTGKLEEVGVLLRGAVTALDTLEDAARIAQAQASSAINAGTVAGLQLEGDVLVVPAGHHDPDTAAVSDALDAIRETLPQGQPPEVVKAWWDSLPVGRRKQLMLAVPVELHDLGGMPDSVKKGLEGSNGYNAVMAVQFARDHANDTSIDKFENNCANFVSTTLASAGLDYKGNTTTDSDGWGRSRAAGIDFDPPGPGSLQGLSHTDTWSTRRSRRTSF